MPVPVELDALVVAPVVVVVVVVEPVEVLEVVVGLHGPHWPTVEPIGVMQVNPPQQSALFVQAPQA